MEAFAIAGIVTGPSKKHKRQRCCYYCFSVKRIRLAGSSRPGEGRLEVYYNGQWGTVCDDYFDNRDATVACVQLGLG